MGKDLYERFPEAKGTLDTADGLLDFDLKGLCFDGPKEKLSTTGFSQPAILAVSVAALRALKGRGPKHVVAASLGLSLGEYSALVSAGSLAFADAVKLVRARGRFMEEASKENPGKMASIIGMETSAVEGVCKEAGCEIANLNCPGQVVISGTTEGIEKAAALAKERGAKRAMILDVSGPFHSSFMKPAAEKLKGELEKVNVRKPSHKFIGNVDAAFGEEPQRIKENLLRQLTGRTLWESSIRVLVEGGVTRFYEIGPGKVLKGLLRRIDPALVVHSIGTVEDIENIGRSE
jgi:[acyl-carrier-protein] S-malonyltransferase